MGTFSIVVERDQETELYIGYVPGWPGAHSQGASLDELQHNLQEVVEMLLEDGDPKLAGISRTGTDPRSSPLDSVVFMRIRLHASDILQQA